MTGMGDRWSLPSCGLLFWLCRLDFFFPNVFVVDIWKYFDLYGCLLHKGHSPLLELSCHIGNILFTLFPQQQLIFSPWNSFSFFLEHSHPLETIFTSGTLPPASWNTLPSPFQFFFPPQYTLPCMLAVLPSSVWPLLPAGISLIAKNSIISETLTAPFRPWNPSYSPSVISYSLLKIHSASCGTPFYITWSSPSPWNIRLLTLDRPSFLERHSFLRPLGNSLPLPWNALTQQVHPFLSAGMLYPAGNLSLSLEMSSPLPIRTTSDPGINISHLGRLPNPLIPRGLTWPIKNVTGSTYNKGISL